MSPKRQLAAIMFTDIEGYTALMQFNEKDAVSFRVRHKESVETLVEKHNGNVIQYFGDGSLSIFGSAVEAVECAVELQKLFLKDDTNIPVRIGLHMGDVIYSDKEVIGDAVNIASRIESCAVPGSVLISDKVHDQIRSQQHLKVEFLDVYELKNVEDAMPIYAMANEPLVVPNKQDVKGKFKVVDGRQESTKKGKRKLYWLIPAFLLVILSFYFGFLSKKQNVVKDYSIAVLPFDNLSTDEDSDIFRDGITEDILTHLSKLKDLHVISRTSVMRYKDTEKSIPKIAKELNVSYILEGSIRKYGDKIRVTAQLIDAETDEHIWADNYDRTLNDIFAIQSEVSQKIVEALELNISFAEQQSLKQIPTKNIDAYELFLKGKKEADARTRESLAESIEMYKAAITLDSLYAEAYAEIANTLYLETYYSGRNPEEAARLSLKYLEKAEVINPDLSRIYSVKGLIYNIQNDIEKARAAFEKAIKLSPNDVTARNQYATFFYYNREYEKQLEQAKIAYELDPLSFVVVNGYFLALTMNFKYDDAEKLMKNYEKYSDESSAFVINRSYFRLYIDQKSYAKAIDPLEKIVGREPAFNRFLAYCYGQIGDTLNANRVIDTIKTSTRIIESERNHQLAVAYSGIKKTDSVLYYSDFDRNKNTRVFKREYKDFFGYLLNDPQFLKILNDHGINIEE